MNILDELTFDAGSFYIMDRAYLDYGRLIAIIRKRAKLSHSPYTILQILSVKLFEKTPIFQAFAHHQPSPETPDMQNQQCLPGFLTGQ